MIDRSDRVRTYRWDAAVGSDMNRVVSLGSINVDRIRHATESELADLEARYDWFPSRGQTVVVDRVPDDFSPGADAVRHGGKGANQAVAAAAAGARTTMLGKVGPDEGEFGVMESLEDAGVDARRIDTSTEPTGTAHVFVDPGGDNRIVVRRRANDTVDRAYVREQYDSILATDCLLLQNEIPVEPVAALLADLDAEADPPTIVLDPAPARGVEALLGYESVTYLTPNEHEYRTLRPWLDRFDGALVRKRGGSDVVVEDGERFTVAPPAVDPVDTTGAGDVLNGFLAARLAAGATLREAVRVATVAASLSTRESGARSGIPTLADVRTFRRTRDGGGSDD